MILKQLSQKHAAVLLTVIILIMVLSVIVISLMSINLSQVKTSQDIIDTIKAQYLAEGEFLKFHQDLTALGTNSLNSLPTSNLGDKTFSFSSVGLGDTSTPNGTLGLTFNVTY